MHKNVPVLDVVINVSGSVEKTGELHNLEHLPIGTAGVRDRSRLPDTHFLNTWWTDRAIPETRYNLKSTLLKLGFASPSELLTKNYGLSLSDQYWIKPKGSGLTWSAVNFFENDFSLDIGEILFGQEPKDVFSIDMVSPDNTCDGWLPKKWIINNGKRVLMKGSSDGYMQG